MRLALSCGRTDWRQFLDEMTPGQFDEFAALDVVEGTGINRVCDVLALGFTALCRAWGTSAEPHWFLPGDDGIQEVEPDQMSDMFRAQFGAVAEHGQPEQISREPDGEHREVQQGSDRGSVEAPAV